MTDQLSPRERQLLDDWAALAPPADFAERVVGARAAVQRRRWIAAIAVATAAAAAIAVVASRPGEPPHVETTSPGVRLPHVPPAPAPVAPAPVPAPFLPPDIIVGFRESITIHDPAGTATVAFDSSHCPSGQNVELSRDAAFRSLVSTSPTIALIAGSWYYRVTCAGEPAAFNRGRIVVLRDDGRRRLPESLASIPIDADGRTYHIDYQGPIPSLDIRAPDSSIHSILHLETGKHDQTFMSATGTFRIPGSALAEGTSTFWTEHGGERSKITTLVIEFDQNAPQVYIDAPRDGDRAGDEIELRGAVLADWTVRVGAIVIPVAPKTGRFSATLAPDLAKPKLVVRFEHREHGIHYYTRRLKD